MLSRHFPQIERCENTCVPGTRCAVTQAKHLIVRKKRDVAHENRGAPQ